MWRWPWMLVSLNLSVLSLTLVSVWHLDAGAETTSLGSTSEQEADFLLENSKRAFQDNKYEEAITQLKRYVARYPGYREYTEAKLLLGRSLLGLKKYKEAIPYLKNYIAVAAVNQPEAIDVRLELGNAYLKTKQAHPAYLIALELEKLHVQQSPSRLQRSSGLLIKGQALLENHKLKPAQLVLNSMEKEAQGVMETNVTAQVQSLKLKIKLYECSRLLKQNNLTEPQVKDRYERHGLCLMEALNLYHSLFSSEDLMLIEDSTQSLTTALHHYRTWVNHPPIPSKIKSKPQIQKLRYQSELRDMLLGERKKRLTEASSSLSSWRKSVRPEQAPYIQSLMLSIESSHPEQTL